ncbi:D-isomer specific 2-hydroxyacid dehydrogenase [Thraustotheca clavata]|uniref:D-isomer specific 2-hydroxyacid dehydrogenase n=1 Tax=Thraustotheca clavata TaxID=74557 RepID=A0A1V9Y7H2_9STRA|nr:D-isomer specific 2-hydroxyacid dehydrogenase [Thraustotheca clavata]
MEDTKEDEYVSHRRLDEAPVLREDALIHLATSEEGEVHGQEASADAEAHGNVDMEGFDDIAFVELNRKITKHNKIDKLGKGSKPVRASKCPLTSEMKTTRAASRVIERLGIDRVHEIQAEYAALKSKFGEQEYEKANTMIRNLIAMGLSQIEIRGILGVGGYRLQRLYSSQLTKVHESHYITDATIHIPIITSIPNLGDIVLKKMSAFPQLLEKISFAPITPLEIDPQDAMLMKLIEDSHVILGDPSECLKILPHARNLKWLQSTFAGVDTLLHQDRRNFALTRAGGIMGAHMAQYVLGWVISKERHFMQAVQFQSKHEFRPLEMRYRHFKDVTVGILGFGDIGMAIGKLAFNAGFRVIGLKRDMTHHSSIDCGIEVTGNLEYLLSRSDYVVNVLPSTPATRNLLSNDVLRVCAKKKACFINVGRGDVIDESSLIGALRRKWLSSAVLDVFGVEPLPADNPLWAHPLVTITPHVAALSMAEDVADVFLKNLWLYLSGSSLNYLVEWDRGY